MIRAFLLILTLTGLPIINNVPKTDTFEQNLLTVSPIPTRIDNYSLPQIQAKAALVIDGTSGIILYKKNPNQRLPMASLTKIMTAIIVLEENNLNDFVTVDIDPRNIEGAKMKLVKGEVISLNNLLYGALIASGNDAAMMLARHNAGTVEKFVKKMNAKARDLGLKNTHFTNPVGYDDETNNQHYSSALDLGYLTMYALKKPRFKKIVKIQSLTVSSKNKRITHTLKSTNQLLNNYLPFEGVKTGTTDGAGECFISLYPTKNKKNQIITVLLNSNQRFQETKVLVENAIQNNKW